MEFKDSAAIRSYMEMNILVSRQLITHCSKHHHLTMALSTEAISKVRLLDVRQLITSYIDKHLRIVLLPRSVYADEEFGFESLSQSLRKHISYV